VEENETAPQGGQTAAVEVSLYSVPMSLFDTMQKDMLSAVKSGDTVTVDILKIVLSALKNARIAKGEDLSEDEEKKAVFAEAKKIKDSIEQYTSAGREDLAQREQAQLDVVQKYLPQEAGEDEIRSVVERVVNETGASGAGSMGMVMGTVMKELQGRADGAVVSRIVREVLV